MSMTTVTPPRGRIGGPYRIIDINEVAEVANMTTKQVMKRHQDAEKRRQVGQWLRSDPPIPVDYDGPRRTPRFRLNLIRGWVDHDKDVPVPDGGSYWGSKAFAEFLGFASERSFSNRRQEERKGRIAAGLPEDEPREGEIPWYDDRTYGTGGGYYWLDATVQKAKETVTVGHGGTGVVRPDVGPDDKRRRKLGWNFPAEAHEYRRCGKQRRGLRGTGAGTEATRQVWRDRAQEQLDALRGRGLGRVADALENEARLMDARKDGAGPDDVDELIAAARAELQAAADAAYKGD